MVYLSLYNKQKLNLAALTCPKYSRYVSLDKQDYKIRHSIKLGQINQIGRRMPKNVLVLSRPQIELVMYLEPCQASAMELKN